MNLQNIEENRCYDHLNAHWTLTPLLLLLLLLLQLHSRCTLAGAFTLPPCSFTDVVLWVVAECLFVLFRKQTLLSSGEVKWTQGWLVCWLCNNVWRIYNPHASETLSCMSLRTLLYQNQSITQTHPRCIMYTIPGNKSLDSGELCKWEAAILKTQRLAEWSGP